MAPIMDVAAAASSSIRSLCRTITLSMVSFASFFVGDAVTVVTTATEGCTDASTFCSAADVGFCSVFVATVVAVFVVGIDDIVVVGSVVFVVDGSPISGTCMQSSWRSGCGSISQSRIVGQLVPGGTAAAHSLRTLWQSDRQAATGRETSGVQSGNMAAQTMKRICREQPDSSSGCSWLSCAFEEIGREKAKEKLG